MMDDAQSPTLFTRSANFAMNAIEPEWTPDVDIARRRPSEHFPAQQFGYLAMLARRRSEFDAARALLREQAGGSRVEAGRDDAGTDGVSDTSAIDSVPKFTQIADAPERVRRSYLRAGGQYFLKDAPYSLAFEDRGRYLVTAHTRTDIVASMIDMVQAKAWARIRVSGHDAFCREVWLQAASIGIEVSGYTPKPADLARLAELNGPTEHTHDRDSEHLPLKPQAAAISAPGSVRDESPVRPVGASVRHAKWEDDGIHLAVIVAAMRERLALTLRRAPEVMVKITNRASGAQGMGAVRRHLQYISRDGHVELEDQDARVLVGDSALQDLFDEWRWGGWGMPEESRRRETFNLMLSMPAGTDRAAVREASRAFAREIFGDGRSYVFAQHDDQPHPHVHLCVRVRGPDGRCLNPRKRDLRTWREVFARQLREHGVDANATPRLVRGETQRLRTQAVVRMQSRGVAPRFYRSVLDERATKVLRGAHIETLAVWRGVAQALAHSGIPEDRAMAMEIVDFVQHMPARQLDPGTTRLEPATECSHRDRPIAHRSIAHFTGRRRSADDRPTEPDPPFDRD